MSKEEDKKQKKKIFPTRAFTSDLKGRQSVRATLGIIRNQLGDDDLIINKFEMVMSSYETAKSNIEAFIEMIDNNRACRKSDSLQKAHISNRSKLL